MPTTITGTDGVSQVQDGAVTATDLTSTLDLSGKTVTLPAGVGGKVLQVVQASTSTLVRNNSGSYVDTGLTGSITPSKTSSKILVLISQQLMTNRDSEQHYGELKILRDSTDLAEWTRVARIAANNSVAVFMGGTFFFQYLDSPSTTSSVTYKTQGRTIFSPALVDFQNGNDPSFITLMEIAG